MKSCEIKRSLMFNFFKRRNKPEPPIIPSLEPIWQEIKNPNRNVYMYRTPVKEGWFLLVNYRFYFIEDPDHEWG